jgi:GntR family transcriptional repressor for pyruvate dehydrogenase complex
MSNPLTFQKVRGARVSDEIAGQIRSAIAAGQLPVGTRLSSERALAEQFGASRNTLREAMRTLENAGVIRLQKGAAGGAIIQDRSESAIVSGLVDMYHIGGIQPAELTEARIMLESIIVRLACERAKPSDIEELSRNIDAAESARQNGDFDARIELHLDFHRILANIAGNRIMVVVMNGVLDIMSKFIRTLPPYDNNSVSPSRRRFLKHFAAKDADAAVSEMELHLRRLQKKYLSQVKVPEIKSVSDAKSAPFKPTAK